MNLKLWRKDKQTKLRHQSATRSISHFHHGGRDEGCPSSRVKRVARWRMRRRVVRIYRPSRGARRRRRSRIRAVTVLLVGTRASLCISWQNRAQTRACSTTRIRGFAECCILCRVPFVGHSTKTALPSVALGKVRLSAKSPFTEC
jgi:hypothetical protein